MPESYKTRKYKSVGKNNSWGFKGCLDFEMDPKNTQLPSKGKVRFVRTDYKSTDYKVLVKAKNGMEIENNIVTLKFLARSYLKMVDPTILKLMFTCEPFGILEQTFVYKSSKTIDLCLHPQGESIVIAEIRQRHSGRKL